MGPISLGIMAEIQPQHASFLMRVSNVELFFIFIFVVIVIGGGVEQLSGGGQCGDLKQKSGYTFEN